jgi:DNA-binding transcriptional regulator YiaG
MTNEFQGNDWAAWRKQHASCSPAEKRKPGWKLRNWRLQNEVIQKRAAVMFGCSQAVLSQYERGDRDPHNEDVVEAIRRRTGVTW